MEVSTHLFWYRKLADKSIRKGSDKWKLLQPIRCLLAASLYILLQILRLVLPRFPALISPADVRPDLKPYGKYLPATGDTGIARALSQILSIINEIPANSRKYEIVRNLAEEIIDENMREGSGRGLKEINRSVVSAGFERTISLLEACFRNRVEAGLWNRHLNRILRIILFVRSVGGGLKDGILPGGTAESNRKAGSAEKFGAELLWLAHKLAACGYANEAVRRWGAASNLARLALCAEPREQGSFVKVSAFLLKKMRESKEEEEESKIKMGQWERMNMLVSWLPFLCHASNGIDAPILNSNERVELERDLEDAIRKLNTNDQEKVLALWLHHFTSTATTSDWPNLLKSYSHWCDAARKIAFIS